MILISLLSIFITTTVILGFATVNLLKKQEKSEDILLSYLDYLDKISRVIELSDKKIKEIDHKGTFESDDEIGYFFEAIKQIQDTLNEFDIRQY
jgi:GTP-binding protein EngB required for normal cell division